MTREDADIQHEGWSAFKPEENCDGHNPYPKGSGEHIMFRIGWTWAEDRWLGE
jgi:hypothetical protein